MANFRPLHDNILVKPERNSQVFSLNKPSGSSEGLNNATPLILIPDTIDQPPTVGVVLAVGPGRRLRSGQPSRMDVLVEDRVLFAANSGTLVNLEGQELLLLRQSDIFAVARAKKSRRPMERDLYTREVIRWAREGEGKFSPLRADDDIFSIRNLDAALPIRTQRTAHISSDSEA